MNLLPTKRSAERKALNDPRQKETRRQRRVLTPPHSAEQTSQNRTIAGPIFTRATPTRQYELGQTEHPQYMHPDKVGNRSKRKVTGRDEGKPKTPSMPGNDDDADEVEDDKSLCLIFFMT